MSQKGWNTRPDIILPRPKVLNKTNVRVGEVDDLVKGQGIRVKVYRTSYCPNVKSIDGSEHEIDCQVCKGANFIDRYPIETVAFIQSQVNESKAFPEGVYDGNTVAATFMRGIELQYFTLVELIDYPDLYIQRIKRQTGDIDVLKYRAIRVHLLVAGDGKEYFEGSDFNLDVNGNIKWCPNKGPDPEQIYSIEYDFAVRFRATRAMHVNRFCTVDVATGSQQVKLNEQWALEKDYLVERKDINGELLPPNKIRSSDED